MFEKQVLLKGINQPEEKLLLAKVLDQADFSLRKQEEAFTDFLDPRLLGLAEKMVQKIPDLNFLCFGGNEFSERMMLGFFPDFIEPSNAAFPISIIRIPVNQKFSSGLTHRDYLGSILGLGIAREKIGDILLFDSETYFYANSEIADYISSNLEKIGKTKVKVDVLPITEYNVPIPNGKEVNLTVASIRLDAVIGSVFHLSRQKAQDLIRSEKVFVNWKCVGETSFLVKEGNMISIRGYGRAKLSQIRGLTKKNRTGITVTLYI